MSYTKVDVRLLNEIVRKGREKAKRSYSVDGWKYSVTLQDLSEASGIPLTESIKKVAHHSACDYGEDGSIIFWFESEKPLGRK